MQPSAPWLSFSVWIPILAGMLALAAGDRNLRVAKVIALAGAAIGFLVTLPLVTGFNSGTSGMQFVELTPWFERFNVNYHLGVDQNPGRVLRENNQFRYR